jgi:hypothetical protein
MLPGYQPPFLTPTFHRLFVGTLLAEKYFNVTPSPACLLAGRVSKSIQEQKQYRIARAGDLGVGKVQINQNKDPRTWLPDICRSRESQLPDSSCLVPSRKGEGTAIWVTSAHHEEVGVNADGHASAPDSRAAAADGPPAGALCWIRGFTLYGNWLDNLVYSLHIAVIKDKRQG